MNDISREIQERVRRIMEDERNTEDNNIRERVREQILQEQTDSQEESDW